MNRSIKRIGRGGTGRTARDKTAHRAVTTVELVRTYLRWVHQVPSHHFRFGWEPYRMLGCSLPSVHKHRKQRGWKLIWLKRNWKDSDWRCWSTEEEYKILLYAHIHTHTCRHKYTHTHPHKHHHTHTQLYSYTHMSALFLCAPRWLLCTWHQGWWWWAC